jgi:tetratricopeptide (TPR) repeat protein
MASKEEKVRQLDGEKKQKASENADQSALNAISPAQRKVLQKCFEHGSMLLRKGEFDYADQMFRQCVSGDPHNLIYTQNLLMNLRKKYNNNKKGGKFSGIRGARAKAGMKKSRIKKNWPGVIKSGLEYLHYNPWDAAALTEMAKACGELEAADCQIEYLKIALEGNLKDVTLNRLAADAFASIALFDEAISCLERIAIQRPNDQVITREINQMTVNKTIHKGGYEHAQTSLDVSVEKQAKDKLTGGAMELSEEQRLRREIRRHPEEVTNYINLSNYFFRLEDFEAAEQVMSEAVQATGAIRATEELEDIQLHRSRLDLIRAKKRASEKKRAQDVDLYKRMKDELNKRELAVFAARADRYPGDLKIKFELGMRLKRSENYEMAIKEFQQARNDADRTAMASLETGECFQQIRQTRLALDAYEMAIANCNATDIEVKKLALYRAGWLCMKLQDNEKAERFLSQLASIDFGFRDVSTMLDEVSKKVNHQGPSEE